MNSNVPAALKTNGWNTNNSFAGWTTTINTTTATYTDGQTLSELCADGNNVTLYGIWRRWTNFYQMTVTTFNGRHEESLSNTSSPWQYYYNTSATAANTTDVNTPNLSISSNYGWQPQGWVIDSDTSTTADITTVAPVTVSIAYDAYPIYYALYHKTTTISYNANDGS
jgi:hypothetical protein